MRRSRFTEEQIIGVLNEGEAGARIEEFCRRHGISPTTYYCWRCKYDGLEVDEACCRLRDPEPRRDSFAVNDVGLTLNLLAANLVELARSLYQRATRQRLSRGRFRQLVLKVATRITLGSRRVTVILDTARAPDWAALWRALTELYPVRGSPASKARPLPA